MTLKERLSGKIPRSLIEKDKRVTLSERVFWVSMWLQIMIVAGGVLWRIFS